MKEIWEPIDGTDGQYEVSNTGKVRSNNYMGHGITKEMKPWGNGGYLRVSLKIKGKQSNRLVHRLVAEAFIPNEGDKLEVNHKDGNKHNNCIENLEWCTRRENLNHADTTGLRDRSLEAIVESNKRAQRAIIATNVETGTETYFPSIQAAQREIGTRDINRVLNGKQRKAKGHTYRYVE